MYGIFVADSHETIHEDYMEIKYRQEEWL